MPGRRHATNNASAGKVGVDEMNAEFGAVYLQDEANPRWVAKPTVAYLWARTVACEAAKVREGLT